MHGNKRYDFIARSKATKQSRAKTAITMHLPWDCFAPLAMTALHAKPAMHELRVGTQVVGRAVEDDRAFRQNHVAVGQSEKILQIFVYDDDRHPVRRNDAQ